MPKWRNKIEIKQYLTNDNSNETVLQIVEKLIPQLNSIRNRDIKSIESLKDGDYKENIEYYLDELERLIEEFQWIKECINDGKESSEFEFYDWCAAFNEYFGQLYDLGDSVTKYIDHFNQEKYLWVG